MQPGEVWKNRQPYVLPLGIKWQGGHQLSRTLCSNEKFGYLSDTNTMDRVLAGSYVYLDGMDAHTQLLPKEANLVFRSLLEGEVVNFVTTTDFQSN
jgi:hypothetical protein